MDALYLLIPIALGVMIVVVVAFIYTVRSGQYDDLEGPAHRILMDDDDPRIPGNYVVPAAPAATAVNEEEEKSA